MSRFIESVKIEDQKLFLADLHQKRVNETFAYFGKDKAIDIQSVFKKLEIDEDGLFKLKITYDLECNYNTQLIPYAVSEIENFALVENNSYDYSFKFQDRKTLEDMKLQAKAEEIIIVKSNHVTDTSFSNLLFFKNKTWFTPSTYLLNGVQRQNLLQKKAIKEAEITLQNLKEFSHFQIINAMNNFDETFTYPIEKIINLPESGIYFEI